MILICKLLVTSEVEHLFTCLLTIWVFCFNEVSTSFAHLSLGFWLFFFFFGKWSLWVLGKNTLSDTQIPNIHFHLRLPFTFSMVYQDEQAFLMLMKYDWLICFFVVSVVCVCVHACVNSEMLSPIPSWRHSFIWSHR